MDLTFDEWLFVEAFTIKDSKQEKEKARKFKEFFKTSKFRIRLPKEDVYFKFTFHAQSRYVEREAPLDIDYINKLLKNVAKSVQYKEKGQIFLVYSNSLERAIAITKEEDDLFKVITVYPQGDRKPKKNTKKVLTEECE